MAIYRQHQNSALCFVLADQAQGREKQLQVDAFFVKVDAETEGIY